MESEMEAIVKVQRPLVSNDQTVPWFVYDRERLHEATIPEKKIPPHVLRAMGNEPKRFFRARWLARQKTWRLLETASWQQW
jgi:hypothetical protein